MELVGATGVRPFFFVQVKTTRRGYSADNARLNVKVKREDVRRLNLYSVPTYIVGINDFDKTAYIVSANGETLNPLSSMSVDYPINAVNRQALWNEVFAFWTALTLPQLTSAFVDCGMGVTVMLTMEANLVAGRAAALVIVHLTRRSDVDIVASHDDAYDLRATVGTGNKRPFGIQVKGMLPASVDPKFARQARNGRGKSARHALLSEAELPICETVVNVVSNEIHWRWLLEPVCDETGKHLRTNNELTLAPLTDEAVSAIVDVVNCWYKAD